MMQPPNSITQRYDVNEDRILVAINAGSTDTNGYWLTRRLALSFIEAANPYLDRMSPAMSKTPTALRGELATMERQVALGRTQQSVTQTPTAVLERASVAAELVVALNVTRQQQGFRLKFRGGKGRETALGCSQAELQRIIYMLEQEVAKAGWRERPSPPEPPTDRTERNRRAH